MFSPSSGRTYTNAYPPRRLLVSLEIFPGSSFVGTSVSCAFKVIIFAFSNQRTMRGAHGLTRSHISVLVNCQLDVAHVGRGQRPLSSDQFGRRRITTSINEDTTSSSSPTLGVSSCRSVVASLTRLLSHFVDCNH